MKLCKCNHGVLSKILMIAGIAAVVACLAAIITKIIRSRDYCDCCDDDYFDDEDFDDDMDDDEEDLKFVEDDDDDHKDGFANDKDFVKD